MLTFEKIREHVRKQKQVRDCETEGMVWNMTSDLNVLCRWEVITWEQLEELEKILNPLSAKCIDCGESGPHAIGCPAE